MAKESTARRCSHCGINGHNSRTCGGAGRCENGGEGLMLFGVRIDGPEREMMRKSQSMGNLMSCVERSSGDQGYVSDGPVHSSSNRRNEKKRGVPWTEVEHRTFLAGLEKLGKGDWRGISRNFVTTRTPTQVSSHAQKYFLRQANNKKKKRRSSLFDLVTMDSDGINEIDKSITVVTDAFQPLPFVMSCEETNPNCTKLVAGSPSASEVSLPTLSLNPMSEVTNQTGPLYHRAHHQSCDFTCNTPYPPFNLSSPPHLDLETNSPLSNSAHDSPFSPTHSGSSDLELRIAPPQRIDSNNQFPSPSNNLLDAIRVV